MNEIFIFYANEKYTTFFIQFLFSFYHNVVFNKILDIKHCGYLHISCRASIYSFGLILDFLTCSMVIFMINYALF